MTDDNPSAQWTVTTAPIKAGDTIPVVVGVSPLSLEALRAAIYDVDDEPLDDEGFCEHGGLGGAGCSEWKHTWVERVYGRLLSSLEPPTHSAATDVPSGRRSADFGTSWSSPTTDSADDT